MPVADWCIQTASAVVHVSGADAPTHPVTRFDDADTLPAVRQDAPGSESRHAGADDNDVEIQSILLAMFGDPASR